MNINRILYVEDSTDKYMDIRDYLNRLGYKNIVWVTDAKKAEEAVENAQREGKPFDLFLFDMHFDFFGENDQKAGSRLMKFFREKGYDTPVIFCSSDNWLVPGSVGTVYYNPWRDWEEDMKDLIETVKEM